MVQDENKNLVPDNGAEETKTKAKTSAPATSTILNDDTKIVVKALVPAVYYTCTKTFESFSWAEVGDVEEMTYLQLRMMKARHPRYFTEKWILPCNDVALKKLGLEDIYTNKLTRADMKKLYESDVEAVEELLSSLNNDGKTELTPKVLKAVKDGKITNVKIIRLLEKHLNIELMKFV